MRAERDGAIRRRGCKSYDKGNGSLDLYCVVGDWRADRFFQRQEPGVADHVSIVCSRLEPLRGEHYLQGIRGRYTACRIAGGICDSSGENEEVYAGGNDASDYVDNARPAAAGLRGCHTLVARAS